MSHIRIKKKSKISYLLKWRNVIKDGAWGYVWVDVFPRGIKLFSKLKIHWSWVHAALTWDESTNILKAVKMTIRPLANVGWMQKTSKNKDGWRVLMLSGKCQQRLKDSTGWTHQHQQEKNCWSKENHIKPRWLKLFVRKTLSLLNKWTIPCTKEEFTTARWNLSLRWFGFHKRVPVWKPLQNHVQKQQCLVEKVQCIILWRGKVLFHFLRQCLKKRRILPNYVLEPQCPIASKGLCMQIMLSLSANLMVL